ncbi:bile acid:sodium symporter family protein [uncultured Rubinisphaera sp.]|uniref:bile acid:sodium symporter family protein n=1 Tax=uncultured Rubinisphaera sp. TaxID=1678686 RepID=UPI0030D9892C
MDRFRRILERYLILWLCLSSGAFLVWGQSTAESAQLLDLFKNYTMQPSIMLAMFCVGMLIPPEELREVAQRWQAVLCGTATQYLAMPLIAFGISELFGFTGAFRAGIILVGCVPGAMASNILTLTGRGNVSYSICVTTLSTLLSPFVVPLFLRIFLGVEKGPDPAAVFANLLQTVALPVILGFAIKLLFKLHETRLIVFAGILANLAILWIIAVAIGLNAARLQNVTMILLSALLIINLLGYLAGLISGTVLKLDWRRRKALILEVGMQNAGVGTMLALTFFPDEATAIPTAVYTFGCMFTGTILANVWFWRSELSSQSAEPAPLSEPAG